jgi:hypothetical protein
MFGEKARSTNDGMITRTQRLGVTRVNSTNVQDEGLMIGGIVHRINLKVKISQSVSGRPLLAPIYRWPGVKESLGFNTYYSVYIQY